LFGECQSNGALYPTYAQAVASGGVGTSDPFFLPPGAPAFQRDIPNAIVRVFDTGHFALEADAEEVAGDVRSPRSLHLIAWRATMRAIVIDKFGGPDSLVYKELPDPEPKAFGINHARCTCAVASGPKPRR
jgi:hypothetical protein